MNLFRKTKVVGEGCGWEKMVARVPRREGSSVRMEDGVSHELEKQPKAAFAPFLKFFTTFFDALLRPAVVRVKGHVNDRGKGQFSLPLYPALLSVIFFFFFMECAYQERVSVSGRRLSDRLRFYFPAYRTVTRALVFASIISTFAKCKSYHDSIKCIVLRSCFINTKCL